MLARWLRWAALGLLAAGASGCFPYPQQYRPDYRGVVRDEAGNPVAGVWVVSCSATHWVGLHSGCVRRAAVQSDADGRFHFTVLREWEWCCLGEAPLPFTVVSACAGDGRLASADLSEQPRGEELVLRLTEPEEVDRTWRGIRGGGQAFARHACYGTPFHVPDDPPSRAPGR